MSSKQRRKESGTNLLVYESLPPTWLPKTHKSGDLGYPGFYPPRPGQDEDVLSDYNVKNGFTAEPAVSAETFTAQTFIKINGDAISKLEDLMDAVFTRRNEQLPPIPASTFRMPSRVTLTDAKRQSWFDDLANPDVPLYKLGKNVPHGAKGHDLLELLHSSNVAIPRAIWLLRVLGANETAGLRNRPSYNPTFYSIEWTGVMTSFMKKQLLNIALPSAPRHGMNMNIKQNFKGVLADVDTRERWISRFTYCLQLLRRFYSEGLVDHPTFLTWLVQQMATCNLAQAGFVSKLADEYLEGMICSRALTHHFADACLSRLSEIRASVPAQYLANTETLLRSLLQRMCLTLPDSFISPRMWITHASLLQYAFVENVLDSFTDQRVEQKAQNIRQLLATNFNDVRRRNQAMLFCNLPSRAPTGLGSAVTEVQLLNSISSATDIKSLHFFAFDTPHDPAFSDKLDRLLTWSVSPFQFGEHRPFAAVTLIREWRDRVLERAHRRHFPPPSEFLQDHLFEWLDTSEVAGDAKNIRAVSLIFGKLVKHELFSYAEYLQRLIARGETGLLQTDNPVSRHRSFLRWIPIYNSEPSLASQRKVTLYGPRIRDTPECLNEREIRKEIRTLLPELFGAELQAPPISTSELLSQCPTLISASRFEQVRTFKQWLMPILRKAIVSQSQDDSKRMMLYKSYSLAVELMTHAQCFHTILDLTFVVLAHPASVDLISSSIDTLQRFHLIWICLDVMEAICSALYSAHLFWKAQGIQSRKLVALLLKFDDSRHLETSARDHIIADITTYTLALQPETAHVSMQMPDVVQDISRLANDPSDDAPAILANGLWFKYRSVPDWGGKAWVDTVTSLRLAGPLGRESFSMRCADFLLQIDSHLPYGLDDLVLQWLLGHGRTVLQELSADIWDALSTVLLYLSVHGALKAPTIFEGLILPTWQSAAHISSAEEEQALSSILLAAHNLFERLMFAEAANDDGTPPANLLEIQCIRTRREEFYLSSKFYSLLSSVPVLLALEHNSYVSEEVRHRTGLIRTSLCQQQSFRQGVYRDLDVVRQTFEQSIVPGGMCENFAEQIAEALQEALCNTRDAANSKSAYPDIALLSPWKLAATAIQMKLILRQMGRTTFSESTRQSAKHDLDRLIKAIFHHAVSAEQACVMADMAKGADPEVVSEFMHNGVQTLTIVLNAPGLGTGSLEDQSRRAGEVLRVLAYIAEPFRKEGNPLPQLNQDAYDKLFFAIDKSIASLAKELSAADADDALIRPESTAWAILLARLLQFLLGFHGQCSASVKAASSETSSSLTTLVLLHSTRTNLNVVAYTLLLDTLYYLLDEVAMDPKASTFDPCFNYPSFSISELPSDLPAEYRMQLSRLLSCFPANSSVENLALAHRDANGTLVIDGPVLNRPWEWIENLGEPPTLDETKEKEERDRQGTKYVVKNSGSLSLENFAARVTGDGILADASSKELRAFEDRLSGDSVFSRDWQESRVGSEFDTLVGSRSRGEGDQDYGSKVRRPTPRASPASSVLSRSSAHHSSTTSMRRPSPSEVSINRHSGSSMGEPIDVDSVMSSKRKTSTASDDDIEIIEGPVPSQTASKKKGRTAGKTKARKR
ncbi:RNA polymerase II mediator complex subunit [Pleurotus pulmonarius]|nr:RNA polymerase II mediator complex subunit [Pleurotus pulmonarius]KAF4599675.1 RNA polymerase II mediator complex subunit [Pleurotus pulmonarius]